MGGIRIGDLDLDSVDDVALRILHLNDNLVARLRILRRSHRDLAAVINLSGTRAFNDLNRRTRREITRILGLVDLNRRIRSRSRVLPIRTLNPRLQRRRRNRALVLRVRTLLLFLLIGDAVIVVVIILGIRLAITISIQLELRLRVVLRAIRVGHLHRNLELLNGVLVQLLRISSHRDHTSVFIHLDGVAIRRREVLRKSELRSLRSINFLALAVLVLKRRLRRHRRTRNNLLILITRLNGASRIRLDLDLDSVDDVALRILHLNDNLVARLRILRRSHRDLAAVINLSGTRAFNDLNRRTRREITRILGLVDLNRRIRSRSRVLPIRTLNPRLQRRRRNRALVLRVRTLLLFLLIGDAVIVVVIILGIRLAITISIQLELRLRVVLRAIRVGHLHRNLELLNGVLVQLLRISSHRDHTSVFIHLDGVAIRRREVLRKSELRSLRSINFLALAVLVLKRRLRRHRRTRNNLLILITRRNQPRSHRDTRVNGLAGAVRIRHHNWNLVVSYCGFYRRVHLNGAVFINCDPVWEYWVVLIIRQRTIRTYNLITWGEFGALRKRLHITVSIRLGVLRRINHQWLRRILRNLAVSIFRGVP